jgi:GTP cyclohydrolase II
VSSIELMTNNPLKVQALRQLGIQVERTPALVGINSYSGAYLETKRVRMGHSVPRIDISDIGASYVDAVAADAE